ncbi:MAG TPA: TonB-dependent receptor [Vicinamibacterales bacterium]|nr:TonB-dependent receptor [Vicinamibacterales bacterium]
MSALRGLTLLTIVCAFLAWPVTAHAQEATISGTITDSSGGVLPGVTVTAIHEASGNTFLAVSDERGAFRIAARTGGYRLTVELSGFTAAGRKVQLLVGQTAVVPIEMAPATLQESLTVSGASPLIDTVSSTLGSNVDPKQMQELPLNGRNFVDLTMLAVGSRQNSSSDELAGLGGFQMNVDGLRVTQNQTGGFGQPKYSRDAIAEFEFVSNRFDATQGGSSGTLVNAITKSGTNVTSGSLSGYFRDDKFIGKDFVQRRVLPYQNQQISATLGSPIKKDRVHFFANYEYEREPQTFSFSSPFPTFNFDLSGSRMESKGGGRLDFQFTPMTRLTVRGNKSLVDMPYDSRYTGGSARHPSSAITTDRHSTDVSGTLTQVFSPRVVNEIRAGYAAYYWIQDSIVSWPGHPYPGLTLGTPIINLRSYTIGMAHNFSHEDERQSTYSVRDNLTLSYDKAGRHDLKVGGEAFYQKNPVFLCIRCQGIYDATGGPIPANIESLFPVWNDISSWNLNGLSSIVRSYTLGVGDMQVQAPLSGGSAWIQDDWRIGSRLTVNLGLRYDLETGVFAEDVEMQPFLRGGRKNDTNNWGPRLGAAFSLTENTVLRGGGGRYFSDPGSHTAYWTYMNAAALQPQIFNDGRADFAANPFNGPTPTFDQVAATLCTVSSAANCLRRSTTNFAVEGNEIPYSDQASFGVQRQFGRSMSIEADYVYTANRAGLTTLNANLAYDPATGVNYAFNDLAKRPYPQWGDVSVRRTIGESNYHGLQMAFTKRMSNRWQASATYLLSGQWNLQNAPTAGAFCENPTTLTATGAPTCDVPVTLHPALQEEWYLSGDQRNRFTFNGIWQIGYGFQASGLYFYGDQGFATPSSGVDALAQGSTGGRVRANGTLVARNSFDIPSIHRVDMRVQRQFRLGGKAAIDGIVEVFNLFNHANYASFTTNETSSRYGQPTDSTNISFQPRMVQFGFRASF